MSSAVPRIIYSVIADYQLRTSIGVKETFAAGVQCVVGAILDIDRLIGAFIRRIVPILIASGRVIPINHNGRIHTCRSRFVYENMIREPVGIRKIYEYPTGI